MSKILKVTKAAWIVNVILLVLSLSASMARAADLFILRDLGSGLIDHIQKMTMAAMAIADMKVWAQRSYRV
jgi:hypothetical protein